MPLDVPRLQWRWTESAAPKQFIAEIIYNILVYYLKQCCSIFGLKVVEKNFYATIFEWCSKILWSKKYIQMYFYYIDYNFISFVSIYTYKHLLWCFDFILYLILPETTVHLAIYLGLESILRKLFESHFAALLNLAHRIAFVTSLSIWSVTFDPACTCLL